MQRDISKVDRRSHHALVNINYILLFLKSSNQQKIEFIFVELPSKIFVNQMSSDARAAGNEGDDEDGYDEDDEDNHHGKYLSHLIYLIYLQ